MDIHWIMDWIWIGYETEGSLLDGYLLDGYPPIANTSARKDRKTNGFRIGGRLRDTAGDFPRAVL
jgi:hypothetical protein